MSLHEGRVFVGGSPVGLPYCGHRPNVRGVEVSGLIVNRNSGVLIREGLQYNLKPHHENHFSLKGKNHETACHEYQYHITC